MPTTMHTARRRTHRTSTAHSAATATTTHTFVVADILRALLTEVAQVIDKLNGIVATNHVVPAILRITRTCRARECAVLIEYVIHTNLNLASLILEYLFAEEEVAEQEILVVVISITLVLVVDATTRKGKALPERHLHIERCRVVKVAVLSLCLRVQCLVVVTVPSQCEIDILRDIRAQHCTEVVAHIAGIVDRTIDHRRCNRIVDTSTQVQVTLHKSERSTEINHTTHRPLTVQYLKSDSPVVKSKTVIPTSDVLNIGSFDNKESSR